MSVGKNKIPEAVQVTILPARFSGITPQTALHIGTKITLFSPTQHTTVMKNVIQLIIPKTAKASHGNPNTITPNNLKNTCGNLCR